VALGRTHEPLADQHVDRPFTADRHDSGNRPPAFGHHDFLTVAHFVEITTQVITQLAYANFGHDATLSREQIATQQSRVPRSVKPPSAPLDLGVSRFLLVDDL
jgi:hypothetical protein